MKMDRWHGLVGATLPAVGLAIAIAVFGTRSRRSAEAPVVFLLSPDHAARLNEEDERTLERLLTDDSGLQVKVAIATTPLDAVEGLAGHADLALLNVFESLLAVDEYGASVRLGVTRDGQASYKGAIVVRADATVTKVDDLAGKRVAYADPFSSSGFVFPAKLLADARVPVVEQFTGSAEEGVARVRDGRADAACVYLALASMDPTLRIVAQTSDIPNEPVVVRRDLPERTSTRLVHALRALADTAEGRSALGKLGDITGFRDADNRGYSAVRAALRSAGETVYDVVPEGARVEARQRRIEFLLGPD